MQPFPMPMIVGSPRSGTTLLRFLLDSNPELAIRPETGFLLLGKELISGPYLRERFFQAITHYPPEAPGWADYHLPADLFQVALTRIQPFDVSDGFRTFYRMYAAQRNKIRWGDKTPSYCSHLQFLQELLSEARFVHVIRDGRDVAVSLRKRWFSPGYDIDTQAKFWQANVTEARRQGRHCRHYIEVRFEDLINDQEQTIREICTFIELDFHSNMLRYYEHTPHRLREHLARVRADGSVIVSQEERFAQQAATTLPPDASRIGQWKSQLTIEDIHRFETVAGDTLRDCGYELCTK